MNRVAADDMF